MPILQQSSPDVRQRLLELFPVSKLRTAFASKASKEKICEIASSSNDQAQIELIANFVDENLKFCRQHIFVYSHTGDAVLPTTIPSGEMVLSGPNHALYLARITYDVVLLDPPENDSIDFLWPIRIELTENFLLVRFVVLEKSVASYFERSILVRGKSLKEELINSSFLVDGTLSTADLNKGIKDLWAEDMIDAVRIKYKKPGSSVTQNMDEEKGLKKLDPEAYEELRHFPLYMSVFVTGREFSEVGQFVADPTRGIIGFPRYAKEEGGDELIRKILENC